MRRWAVVLIALLGACSAKDDRVPATPLDHDKFVQVLTGSLLVEARMSHEMIVDKRVDSPIQRYYDELFKAQGVTQADFKRTYDIYAQHPKALKAVYEEALVQLQQREDANKAHPPAH